ncbi:nucleotide-binding universal stress UspA family protein [Amycolatopsis sulphurea]|uniref:Nucleotide-binding universal stress UspA family protein n=1 Tax=Amycolatopsis sulphurea TaxID=76022 RepID=A0A2A9G0Q2_9PSEU|nr:universal stress protein [Amycolatopsis sulphurea]PFG57224.1 nucleotide-binding universal stress UspA family protein [Amycolatopsis sulphurea]
MNSPGRFIIVGVDGSPHGDAALRWALGVAAQPGDRVHAVVVRPAEGLLRGTSFALHGPGAAPMPHNHISSIRQEYPDAPEVTVTTPRGDPATELVTESTEADLLVVGAHGTGPAREPLLGSVSRECVRYSRCPVVVITPEAARHPRPPGESRRTARACRR